MAENKPNEDNVIDQFVAQAPDHYFVGDGKGLTPEGLTALEKFLWPCEKDGIK